MCHRAKPAQDTRVFLHSPSPVSLPIDRLFTDFVGPLFRTKRDNIAFLVVVHSFSKFVAFCSYVRWSYWECQIIWNGDIFRLMVRLNPFSRTTSRFSAARSSKICASDLESNILLPPTNIPNALWRRGWSGTRNRRCKYSTTNRRIHGVTIYRG